MVLAGSWGLLGLLAQLGRRPYALLIQLVLGFGRSVQSFGAPIPRWFLRGSLPAAIPMWNKTSPLTDPLTMAALMKFLSTFVSPLWLLLLGKRLCALLPALQGAAPAEQDACRDCMTHGRTSACPGSRFFRKLDRKLGRGLGRSLQTGASRA